MERVGREPKTAEQMGITESEWVDLAESLILSREFARLMPQSPLGMMHQMQVDYLERLFGIVEDVDNQATP